MEELIKTQGSFEEGGDDDKDAAARDRVAVALHPEPEPIRGLGDVRVGVGTEVEWTNGKDRT